MSIRRVLFEVLLGSVPRHLQQGLSLDNLTLDRLHSVCGQTKTPTGHLTLWFGIWDVGVGGVSGCWNFKQLDTEPGSVTHITWQGSTQGSLTVFTELCAAVYSDITGGWTHLVNFNRFFKILFAVTLAALPGIRNLIPHQILPGFKSALHLVEKPLKIHYCTNLSVAYITMYIITGTSSFKRFWNSSLNTSLASKCYFIKAILF